MTFLESFIDGFNKIFDFMGDIKFLGVSILDVAFLNFFLCLFFAMILAPLFGTPRDGTLMQVRSESNARKERRNAEKSSKGKKK